MNAGVTVVAPGKGDDGGGSRQRLGERSKPIQAVLARQDIALARGALRGRWGTKHRAPTVAAALGAWCKYISM